MPNRPVAQAQNTDGELYYTTYLSHLKLPSLKYSYVCSPAWFDFLDHIMFYKEVEACHEEFPSEEPDSTAWTVGPSSRVREQFYGSRKWKGPYFDEEIPKLYKEWRRTNVSPAP